MIRRELEHGLLILTQTAHSWISGQMAQRWGNDGFSPPSPRAEVLTAVDQHDCGWADWELAPRVLPDGRPMGFMEMVLDDHLAIWGRGVERVTTTSRYAALLMSLHGTALLSTRLERTGDTEEERVRLRAFLARERQRQVALRADLGRVPYYLDHLHDAALQANLRLVQACDALSLMLCVPWPAERRLEVSPDPRQGTTVSLVARVEGEKALLVNPWPFAETSFVVCAEARRLARGRYADDDALRSALASAPLERLEFEVRPG